MPLRLTVSRVETWMRTGDEQTSFQRQFVCADVLWFCRATVAAAAAPGGWSQTILEGDRLDVEAPGLRSYTWTAVVRPVGLILAVTMQVNLPHLCHCAAQTAHVRLVLYCGQSGPRQCD